MALYLLGVVCMYTSLEPNEAWGLQRNNRNATSPFSESAHKPSTSRSRELLDIAEDVRKPK